MSPPRPPLPLPRLTASESDISGVCRSYQGLQNSLLPIALNFFFFRSVMNNWLKTKTKTLSFKSWGWTEVGWLGEQKKKKKKHLYFFNNVTTHER